MTADTSKFLSFILRHKPEAIGLNLDANGWADLNELINKANASDEMMHLSLEKIKEVIANSDKQRFILSDNGTKIRANQGHSIKVELQLKETIPPEFLYHGTAKRFLESIEREGLKSGERHHVHLTENIDSALDVGARYGKPVLLNINALIMYQQGFKFYLSENNVWLTEFVPIQFIWK